MKTIKEIFETNPSLLEEKEVKELIEQFSIQFKKIRDMHYNNLDKITDITMHSEFFLKDGIPAKEAIEKIHNLLFQ